MVAKHPEDTGPWNPSALAWGGTSNHRKNRSRRKLYSHPNCVTAMRSVFGLARAKPDVALMNPTKTVAWVLPVDCQFGSTKRDWLLACALLFLKQKQQGLGEEGDGCNGGMPSQNPCDQAFGFGVPYLGMVPSHSLPGFAFFGKT